MLLSVNAKTINVFGVNNTPHCGNVWALSPLDSLPGSNVVSPFAICLSVIILLFYFDIFLLPQNPYKSPSKTIVFSPKLSCFSLKPKLLNFSS